MIKLISILLVSVPLIAPISISKISFYTAFKSENKTEIEKEINKLNKFSSTPEKNAYIGALIMKSSQFLKTPKEKVEKFKKGKTFLEDAIESDSKNPEFRFLRLAIQEKSPKILRYNANIEEDKKIVLEKYHTLELVVKKVISKYAEESNVLSKADL